MTKVFWKELYICLSIFVILPFATWNWYLNNLGLQGITALKKGNYQEAIDFYTKSITGILPGNDENAHYWLGNCYYDMREYDKALSEYDSVLRIFNSWKKVPLISYWTSYQSNVTPFPGGIAATYRARGRVKFALHQYEEAIADYNQSIALNHVNPSSLQYRGEAYAALGQNELAKQDLNQSNQMESWSWEYRSKLMDDDMRFIMRH